MPKYSAANATLVLARPESFVLSTPPTFLLRRAPSIRLFASKDDLVAAYLEREDRLYREWFDAAVEAGGPDPRGRILSLFDALAEQVRPDRCRGCPFQLALTEFPDTATQAHRNAVANKAWVRARLGELTDELAKTSPVDDPAALADELALLMDGVYASAQASSADGPAARALAETLLIESERQSDR